MTKDYLIINIGFKELPHFTVMAALNFITVAIIVGITHIQQRKLMAILKLKAKQKIKQQILQNIDKILDNE